MSDSYPDDWDTRRRRVYRRDKYTCSNCGVRGGGDLGDDGSELHAHHIVPISKGGTHATSNLKTLCADCHDAIHKKNSYAPTASNQQEVENAGFGQFVLFTVIMIPLMSWLGYVNGGLLTAAGVLVMTILFLGLLLPAFR